MKNTLQFHYLFCCSACSLQTHSYSCNVIIWTIWCQVQMALSWPTTIPVEFSTLEISSGTTILYCPSIKRSKLPSCKTKPPSDRASGLLLMATIKAGHRVFLQGLSVCLHPAWRMPGTDFCSSGRANGFKRCTGTSCEWAQKYFPLFFHISAV